MSWPPFPTGRPYSPWHSCFGFVIGAIWIILAVHALNQRDDGWAYFLFAAGGLSIAQELARLVRYQRRSGD